MCVRGLRIRSAFCVSARSRASFCILCVFDFVLHFVCVHGLRLRSVFCVCVHDFRIRSTIYGIRLVSYYVDVALTLYIMMTGQLSADTY